MSELLARLGPRLSRRDDPSWPLAQEADVLSADLAIVHAPEKDCGWDLRWVELQTFTSLVSTIYTLHRAAGEIWPELEALAFWGRLPDGADWLSTTRGWMAPQSGAVLLENAPWRQATRADFEAACHWFDLAIAEPQMLRNRDGRLEWRADNDAWKPVPHIANRLILHELPQRSAIEALLSRAAAGWNSHPAWYYRIDKGVMPELALPGADRCAGGDRWRELDLPAEALVAKRCHTHAGHSVRLQLDAAALDGLEEPASWIVQPRFAAAPILIARDGAPLYGEIRCVVALSESKPWVVCRLARLTRGPMASAASWSGAAGEGAVPVYAPPD